MPKFDWTISMGNVLTAAGLLAGFLAAHRQESALRDQQHEQNIRTLKEIETRMDVMFRWFVRNVIDGKE